MQEALQVIQALRCYVQAIPEEVAAKLPAMPGVDADWMDTVEADLKTAISADQASGHRSMQIPVTSEMIAAAESVEDLYKRGTPQTWATVYRAMHRLAPLTHTTTYHANF